MIMSSVMLEFNTFLEYRVYFVSSTRLNQVTMRGAETQLCAKTMHGSEAQTCTDLPLLPRVRLAQEVEASICANSGHELGVQPLHN